MSTASAPLHIKTLPDMCVSRFLRLDSLICDNYSTAAFDREDRDRQQRFMEGVLKGFDVGVIYLTPFRHVSQTVYSSQGFPYRYSYLDGQKRALTLRSFIDGEFGLHKHTTIPGEERTDWEGVTADKLPPHLRQRVLDTELTVKVVEGDLQLMYSMLSRM